eukprot:8096848-Pyramimonas_sp.AAC.2
MACPSPRTARPPRSSSASVSLELLDVSEISELSSELAPQLRPCPCDTYSPTLSLCPTGSNDSLGPTPCPPPTEQLLPPPIPGARALSARRTRRRCGGISGGRSPEILPRIPYP